VSTDTPNPASLFKRMAEVMDAVDRIPKRGKNSFHGYQYATEADVSDAVRRELAKRDIAVFVSSHMIEARKIESSKGRPTILTDVAVEMTFACGETGATWTVAAAGTGEDGSDKGIYKAITGAVKYALMKSLLIPTGDDPEDDSKGKPALKAAAKKPAAKKDNPGPEYVTKAQADELFAAAVAAGTDPALAKRQAEVTLASRFTEALTALKAKAAKA
jgi:hypothetical protein